MCRTHIGHKLSQNLTVSSSDMLNHNMNDWFSTSTVNAFWREYWQSFECRDQWYYHSLVYYTLFIFMADVWNLWKFCLNFVWYFVLLTNKTNLWTHFPGSSGWIIMHSFIFKIQISLSGLQEVKCFNSSGIMWSAAAGLYYQL